MICILSILYCLFEMLIGCENNSSDVVKILNTDVYLI